MMLMTENVQGRITLSHAVEILSSHGLLRELIAGEVWADSLESLGSQLGKDLSSIVFSNLTYDSRTIDSASLLVCKGRFHSSYLDQADALGLPCYVAQEDFSSATKALGIIVTDVRQALALLSAAFYGDPASQLKVVGITGTKGKTTTAYFTHAILSAYSGGKAALLSSVDNCVDGTTFTESNLTTPESLDLYRMMRQAVDAGMEYLVMEVSSQAYKVQRVFGLRMAVGAFINISPDHISPIEHPTFEDYFYCKRQIAANSDNLVMNATMAHASLVAEDARAHGAGLSAFRLVQGESGSDHHEEAEDSRLASLPTVTASPLDPDPTLGFRISDGQGFSKNFRLSIAGDFNYANAAAAIAIVKSLGMDLTDPAIVQALEAMEKVTISGRMETFSSPQGSLAVVDYAHNGVSTTALLDYVDKAYGKMDPRIILVTGSAGNKAYDRRQEIVQAAQDRIARFIFTEEDTDTEPMEEICQQMDQAVTNPQVEHGIVLDRTHALEEAVRDAARHQEEGGMTVILAIGKGNERWIKHLNRHVAYEGDDKVLSRLLEA